MKSWVDGADQTNCEFPLENLPYGVFSSFQTARRCGVAIGNYVLDLAALEVNGLLTLPSVEGAFSAPHLNKFMELGSSAWGQVREQLTVLLSDNPSSQLRERRDLHSQVLFPLTEVTLHLPFRISEYTDFYSGRQHAFNVGVMFRGEENALPPNWLHMPIAYNGRASTVVVSGTDIVRPSGQLKSAGYDTPIFSPSRRLDLELEIGAVIGGSNEMGRPVSVAEADEMIFGYVLLNDWSARDIQAWEYQPLGPFLAKAFATSISPWVVPKAALEPFRVRGPEKELDLLPYLREPGPMHYHISLEIRMTPAETGQEQVIARTNSDQLYYSPAQQLAHHASSGCQMNVGDLLGSGTISGPEKDQFGSLLELTWGGKEPLIFSDGVTRTFIEDGDRLTLAGWAQGRDYRVGFGACTGMILPATPFG